MNQVLAKREPKRILVVDDRDAWLLATEVTYGQLYQLKSAKDGETALAVARGYQPSLSYRKRGSIFAQQDLRDLQ